MLGFPPTTEKVAMGRRASRLSRERGVWPPQFPARDGPAASAGRTQRPSPSAATASTVLAAGRFDLRWRRLARPRGCRAAKKRDNEFSPPDVDCHVTLPWGHAHAKWEDITVCARAVCGHFSLRGTSLSRPRMFRLASKVLHQSGYSRSVARAQERT